MDEDGAEDVDEGVAGVRHREHDLWTLLLADRGLRQFRMRPK